MGQSLQQRQGFGPLIRALGMVGVQLDVEHPAIAAEDDSSRQRQPPLVGAIVVIEVNPPSLVDLCQLGIEVEHHSELGGVLVTGVAQNREFKPQLVDPW